MRKRQSRVEHHPQGIAAAAPRQPGGEARVVGERGASSHQDRVAAVAQPVHRRARRIAGHPARISSPRGDLAVQGGGHLQGDVRAARGDEAEPGLVEGVAVGLEHPGLDENPAAAQAPDAAPVHERVGIARPDEDAAHPSLEDGEAARRRSPPVVARLEGGVEVGTPGSGAGPADGHHLGVRRAGPGVVSPSHHLPVPDEDRAHGRVRARPAEATAGLADGEPHEVVLRPA